MKRIVKSIIFRSANLLNFPYIKKGNYPILLPFYHAVENQHPAYISGYQVKNEKQFKQDINFLLKHYVPVTLDDLKKPEELPSNAMHITFDDGLKSCSNIIAPILLEKSIPATFFINPAFVDNNDIFHRFIFDMAHKKGIKLPEQLKYYPDKNKLLETTESKKTQLKEHIKNSNIYMGMHELMQLKKEGFSIGAHSWDHPEFYKIDQRTQYKQVKNSMQWIEKHFNPTTKAFAFPYTDHGISNGLLKKIHSENLVDLSFGTAGLKYDSFHGHLQRIPMEKRSYETAQSILKYEHFYFKIRQLMKKNTVLRDD